MILISHILTIRLPGNISRSGVLAIRSSPVTSSIILAHPALSWLTHGQQLIQDHLDSFRISPAYPARVSGLPFTPPMAVQPEHQPARQALRRVSELAKPPQALLATQVWKPQAWPPPQTLHGHSRPHTTPQALCAEMANCSASRSGCSRKRHIPSAYCSISPGQGHQAE